MTFRMLKLREKVLKNQNNNLFLCFPGFCRESISFLMKSRIFVFLSASIFLFVFNNGIHLKRNFRNVIENKRITITAAGDLMCHSPQFEYAKNDKGEYNFDENFYYVKRIIEKADLAFANFETTLAGKGAKYSGYPTFNTPDQFLDAVKNAGFNFLFTSNNHAFDRGKKGVLRTIEKISLAGLKRSGTFSSDRDMDSLRIVNVKGISIGVLSYAEHLNGFKLPAGNEFLVNLINAEKISRDIKRLKYAKPDLVIVYFHFGDENKREPNNYQKEIVKKAIAAGADIILASHPHVLERIETFKPVSSKLDTGFVAYSLGNFISNQRWRYSDAGVILNFTLEKGIDSSITLTNIEVIPTWVFKGRLFSKNSYTILPAELAFSASPLFFLTPSDIKQMKESYSDCERIMFSGLRLSPQKVTFKRFSSSN